MRLDNATFMKLSLRKKIRLMSNFWIGKKSKMNMSFPNDYLGTPFGNILPPTDAKKSSGRVFVGLGFVLPIDANWNIAKIFNSVVRFVAVNVVNGGDRPLSVNMEPNKSVNKVLPVINPSSQIPRLLKRPNNIADFGVLCRLNSAFQNSSLLVVGKQIADAFCGEIKILGSHAVSPVKKWFGQRPSSVDALSGLRYFNTWRLV